MKKTKSMRVAVAMLALTLITSCFVGGTFAKYTTSGKTESTARVAKFGVTVSATGSLFSTKYETHDTTADQAKIGTHSVIASTDAEGATDNIVAPGTSGSLTESTITGTPEVAVKVTNTATVSLGDKWALGNGEYYCPLTITVNGNNYYGMAFESAEAFAAAVKSAIDATSVQYAANTKLDDEVAVKVSWAWAFEGTDGKQTDEKDTYLGDQAAAGNAATVTIDITTTVTQID